jgi:hypothetical protein
VLNTRKKTVLILCTGNSCRSQMAEDLCGRTAFGCFFSRGFAQASENGLSGKIGFGLMGRLPLLFLLALPHTSVATA